ncbi:serine hydrolase domain-containing protein [Streptosporangium sp. NPDC050855]|uniref:serine hydrolase domain-containing protein n=1 Tax=Streptosporangium sp. NPDC050855 TaxID=3366194 RepID=UPI00379131D1
MTFAGLPHRGRTVAGLGLSAVLLTCAAASPALAAPEPPAPAASAGSEPAPAATPTTPTTPAGESGRAALDREALRTTIRAIHEAGMYGSYSAVRNGGERWTGAAGVADVRTRRPVHPRMLHRVGSITKTFTAVAILQQVERGRVELDAPVARYLPGLLPQDLAGTVTVRMLLNHTSGIGDYVAGAFPSLVQASPQSLDDHRFRRIAPEELVRLGLEAPRTGEPGQNWSYSNTNYVIAGLLLEKVTGTDAERYITREVIRRAGLRDTSFPRTPFVPGPHSKAYEALYGYIDPPRDYSVYDMSWATTAGAIVSTMEDINRFYRVLLGGGLLKEAQLDQMRTTVPVPDGQGGIAMHYGLGIYAQDIPCGRFWGHDGSVFGMGTISMSSPDGRRQVSYGFNLMKYQRIGENGYPVPHAIDMAMARHLDEALCGPAATTARRSGWPPLLPTQQVLVKR